MTVLTAHGGAFSFKCSSGTFNGTLTRIQVESPTAELVDLTAISDKAGSTVIVPTGDWKGGSVTVDFLYGKSTTDPIKLVRGCGELSFKSSGLTVTRQVVLESASVSASTGDIVRGSAKFVVTDYKPTSN
jgi:hypothetical protein